MFCEYSVGERNHTATRKGPCSDATTEGPTYGGDGQERRVVFVSAPCRPPRTPPHSESGLLWGNFNLTTHCVAQNLGLFALFFIFSSFRPAAIPLGVGGGMSYPATHSMVDCKAMFFSTFRRLSFAPPPSLGR